MCVQNNAAARQGAATARRDRGGCRAVEAFRAAPRSGRAPAGSMACGSGTRPQSREKLIGSAAIRTLLLTAVSSSITNRREALPPAGAAHGPLATVSALIGAPVIRIQPKPFRISADSDSNRRETRGLDPECFCVMRSLNPGRLCATPYSADAIHQARVTGLPAGEAGHRPRISPLIDSPVIRIRRKLLKIKDGYPV